MKRILILVAGILLLAGCARKEVRIKTDEGTLVLQPLVDNAIRVRLEPADYKPLDELVYVEKVAAPKFKVTKKNGVVEVRTAAMAARYENGVLTFLDADGNVLLRENGHNLVKATVQGEPTYDATLRLASPEDEFLYGTGQFQDGFLNIRGVSRRLTQVNTQIALPFILSNKGYGLLWNNYGLTDFNPADQSVALAVAGEDGEGQTVNATGTAGNRRERRFSRSFAGSVDIPEDGTYALLLDVGQKMSRRHYLAIDGEPVVDVSNTWLPPTTSALVPLTAGTHTLAVEGVRTDSPVLYWKKVDDATTFHSPVAAALDYTVFAGKADEVIGAYRTLTGPVPEMPDWMFGYIHCRERYHSSEEILANAREFKERGLPLDVIVQDWQWWGPTGWNSMEFDKEHYPDPKALTDTLHDMGTRFMISVWSKVDKNSNLGKRLAERGSYIDGTDWIDFFNPEVAAFYAQNFVDSLARPYNIDAWWFDATEPENDDLAGRRIGKDQIPGEWYRNVYPLMVTDGEPDDVSGAYRRRALARHPHPERLPGRPALRRGHLVRRRGQRLRHAAAADRGRPRPDGLRPALVDLRRRRFLPPGRPVHLRRIPGAPRPLGPGIGLPALHAGPRLHEPDRALALFPRDLRDHRLLHGPPQAAGALYPGLRQARLRGGLHPDASARLRLPGRPGGPAAGRHLHVRPRLPRPSRHRPRRHHLAHLPPHL